MQVLERIYPMQLLHDIQNQSLKPQPRGACRIPFICIRQKGLQEEVQQFLKVIYFILTQTLHGWQMSFTLLQSSLIQSMMLYLGVDQNYKFLKPKKKVTSSVDLNRSRNYKI